MVRRTHAIYHQTRQAFSAGFFSDLAGGWAQHGRAAMEKTAIDQPGVFFATCARLLPGNVALTIEQSLPGNLSMEDWATLREVLSAVREGLPGAHHMRAGQTFQHVLGALRNCPDNAPNTNSSICSSRIRE
jgi:hypothetical protein